MQTIIYLLVSALFTTSAPAEHCTTIASTYSEGSSWQFVLLNDEGERLVYSIKYVSHNKKGKEDGKGNRNIIVAQDLYLVNVETMIPGYNSDKPVNISLLCSPNPGDAVGDVRKVSTYTVDNLGQKSEYQQCKIHGKRNHYYRARRT